MVMSRLLIKNYIEDMSKENQIEVLRIIAEDETICLNENSNGTFINLTNVNEITIKKIEEYIKYIEKQENQLEKLECQREILTNKFFKEDKPNIEENNIKDIPNNIEDTNKYGTEATTEIGI